MPVRGRGRRRRRRAARQREAPSVPRCRRRSFCGRGLTVSSRVRRGRRGGTQRPGRARRVARRRGRRRASGRLRSRQSASSASVNVWPTRRFSSSTTAPTWAWSWRKSARSAEWDWSLRCPSSHCWRACSTATALMSERPMIRPRRARSCNRSGARVDRSPQGSARPARSPGAPARRRRGRAGT